MRNTARPSGPDEASAHVEYLCSVERAPQVSIIPDIQADEGKQIARGGAPCHHATTQRKGVSHSR